MQHPYKKIRLLLLEGGKNMDEKKQDKLFTEEKKTNEMKVIKKEKISNNLEIDTITAYTQLVLHTLQNSATEINQKAIREEVKMFYEKFGNEEVKRIANMIMKEKKEKK